MSMPLCELIKRERFSAEFFSLVYDNYESSDYKYLKKPSTPYIDLYVSTTYEGFVLYGMKINPQLWGLINFS